MDRACESAHNLVLHFLSVLCTSFSVRCFSGSRSLSVCSISHPLFENQLSLLLFIEIHPCFAFAAFSAVTSAAALSIDFSIGRRVASFTCF